MTTIELIDTHIHLDDDRFDVDRDQIMARAAAQGVRTMVVPATTRRSWQKIQTITESYPDVNPAYGLHPLFLVEHNDSDLSELEAWAGQSRCIAIGECGLDRNWFKQPPLAPANTDVNANPDSTRRLALTTTELFERQVYYFEAQLNIAAKVDLPVIVHALKAVEQVIQSIKKNASTRGVVHSFNGSQQQARQLIDLGYRLSFGGAATYSRASKIRQLIQSLPADSILIETDAPDQVGFLNKGHRNEPAYLPEVLQTIAELRDESLESTAIQCNQNATDLFKFTTKFP